MNAPIPVLKGIGPRTAKIVIVTEFATADDLWRGFPLAGTAGDAFGAFLHEAGIIRSECYITSVLKYRPKGDSTESLFSQNKAAAERDGLFHTINGTYVNPNIVPHIHALHSELSTLSPDVILALGSFSMFCLTEVYGSVDTWRGSHLEYKPRPEITVIPTYTIRDIYARWELKSICVRDLQRVRAVADNPEFYVYPNYKFLIRPTFFEVEHVLSRALEKLRIGTLQLSCDVETVARQISCIGLAWSAREAICIPLMTLEGHYWSDEKEISIMTLLHAILTHPNIRILGQNFNYDSQHFAHSFGFIPHLAFDTMIAQHVLLPGVPKALDFLSSMYAHWHRYWKDEMNDYSRLPENMDQYWTYNCKDCVTTFEVAGPLREMLGHLDRWPQYDFIHRVSLAALRTMLRGMRIDQKSRSATAEALIQAISEHEQLIHHIVGFPLNVGSSKQMKEFFYDELGLPVQYDRKTRQPSLSAKALATLCQKEPLIQPLVELIEKKRSLGVFLSTFCLMPLSPDGRMRCSFNVCGTETFRFSSSKDAFGTGGNLQNIPKGEEE